MKNDIYERVTRQIITELEKGNRPWSKPWDATPTLPKRHMGEAYRGANIILLWIAELSFGYGSCRYMTFKQAQALKGHVRKGEKGHLVVKYGTFTPKESQPSTTEAEPSKIPYLKGYTVFNVEQIEDLPEEYYDDELKGYIAPEQRLAEIEAFIAATGARIVNHGYKACYREIEDSIIMPPFETFHSPEAYYSTILHELAHWTGSKKRLDRRKGKKFGDNDYAFEELIAELTACFVGTSLGFRVDIENSAAYLDNWLKGMKNDRRFFLSACSKAQAAADYLLAFRFAGQTDFIEQKAA